MSRPSSAAVRLLRMPLRSQQDVVSCRQRARLIVGGLGIEGLEQVRIATAVSEIARNAVEYAKDGMAEFFLETSPPALIVAISDRGKGIPNLAVILEGRYQSPTGLGRGLVGAHRLMDKVDVETSESGTSVFLEKKLTGRRRIETGDLQKITDLLARTTAVDPAEELANQNRDLSQALEEVQKQKAELEERARVLEQMSTELAETNRGVLALYDELDSLHRLGSVIASQLDLASLVRAITDATTELSNSEFGAFFHRLAPDDETFQCHTSAGALHELARRFDQVTVADLFGTADVADGVLRIDDLMDEPESQLIARGLSLRSYLSAPIFDAAGMLRAVMIFGHRLPHRFTERNERIMSAVTSQAAVGMENARLYTSVQAANAAKDHFLATLSHELRTPLNPIFMLLSELKSDPSISARVRDDLAIIQRNLDLEARLIDDLLDVTRIVKGKFTLRSECTDVHDLLRRTAVMCLANSAQKTIRVDLRPLAEKHHVNADSARLQQVFWNLLNNAIKFTPVGGEISIATMNLAEGAELQVEFTDTGRGIPTEMIERIFRPFEQGDVAGLGEFGGLGLGLTIAQGIVAAHGGKLQARSEGLGRGATFAVLLSTTAPLPAVSTDPAAEASTGGKKLRILVVDDHADTLATMERILARRGHTVFIARDAESALTIVSSEPLDFLISDIGLPDRSGLALMQEVLQIKNLKGVALSGYGAEEDLARSREAGFSGHLTKPISIEDLFALIASESEK
jgi:signal transduction histidine kinase